MKYVKSEPNPCCGECVHFALNAMLDPKGKCDLTGHSVTKSGICKLFASPVPYDQIEVGDLVEYWWVYDKPVKGLILDKEPSGHLSLGEDSEDSELDKNKMNIPNGVFKNRIIKIIQKQAIDGEMYKRYGV